MLDDSLLARSTKFQESLQRAFKSALSSTKTSLAFGSLTLAESHSFREFVMQRDETNSATQNRDHLIGRILIETGLRSGELLKLYCADLEPKLEIQTGKYIAVIKVIKRPNDINDTRVLEPAAKTMPGPIAISQSLAEAIHKYVVVDRRATLDKNKNISETPYLFISHSGINAGKPISYRNLHRIIVKLGKQSTLEKKLAPHYLRHTHFTELRTLLDKKGVNPNEARRILIERGHWSPNSNMPDHYSQRYLAEKQSEFIDRREQLLNEKNVD